MNLYEFRKTLELLTYQELQSLYCKIGKGNVTDLDCRKCSAILDEMDQRR